MALESILSDADSTQSSFASSAPSLLSSPLPSESYAELCRAWQEGCTSDCIEKRLRVFGHQKQPTCNDPIKRVVGFDVHRS